MLFEERMVPRLQGKFLCVMCVGEGGTVDEDNGPPWCIAQGGWYRCVRALLHNVQQAKAVHVSESNDK